MACRGINILYYGKRDISSAESLAVADIPFCLNLNVRTLCQTLSNALDIPKNTALTSRLSSEIYIFHER